MTAGSELAKNFDQLDPETCFRSAELQGFRPTGALFPLNSYENRVYELALEDGDSLIGKYYRPGRWSAETIAEEHLFMKALAEAEIPIVLPYSLPEPLDLVDSVAEINGLYYTFYPKFRGREHDEISDEDRRWMGRTLGRLHNIGEAFPSKHRRQLNPTNYGTNSLEFILRQDFLPKDLLESISAHLEQAIQLIVPTFYEGLECIPLHGDCHPGNILWNSEGPSLVDFDDMVVAPPIQDLWMLFHGSADDIRRQKDVFFEGYSLFRDFNQNSFSLVEPLRTLRMIHHAAWIGRRYTEAIFQRAFPYYRERRYWEEFLLSIKEQIALLQEIPWE